MSFLLIVYNRTKTPSEHTTTGFLENFSKFLIELFGFLFQNANFANRKKEQNVQGFQTYLFEPAGSEQSESAAEPAADSLCVLSCQPDSDTSRQLV